MQCLRIQVFYKSLIKIIIDCILHMTLRNSVSFFLTYWEYQVKKKVPTVRLF